MSGSAIDQVQEGMPVYGRNDRMLGTVERRHGDGIHVNGKHVPGSTIARVAQRRVFLKEEGERLLSQSAAATGPAAGREAAGEEIVVPVAEERLNVEKRDVELGHVEVRKTVTEEQQTIPVTLMREEVHVEERNIADRPVSAADAERLFEGGTIRVPVRGEEAVVEKEAVVTGEVVINKEQTFERQEVTETVRREQVDVEEDYQRARGDFQQHFAGRQAAGRTYEQAEPYYRGGFLAGRDPRYQGREFEQVEPELRQSYGSSGSGDSWEHLREEIREGWRRARAERS